MDDIRNFDAQIFEHQFWLQIMGDHARFLFLSLAPEETEQIKRAQEFIQIYDELLALSYNPQSEINLYDFNHMAYGNTFDFKEFKLLLLSNSLESKIKIHLAPTFINHMLNELDEYILVMNTIFNQKSLVFHPIHYHLLWLLDGSGHASSISSKLDEVEKDMISKSKVFEKQFTDLYLKALEFNGYLRTKMYSFPALGRLNQQAESSMVSFKGFLEEILALRFNSSLLGTLLPLMADHMAREECYYLIKISESAVNIERPECNPARPRIEN